METVDRLINELKEYENNPRKNADAVKQVAESIRQFGFKVPLVIDKNGVIVCGHTRFKAAKKLKMKTVPCVVADDLSEDKIRAFRLADNKAAETSGWDNDLLAVELGAIELDMSAYGFIGPEPGKGNIKEDEVPELDMEEWDTEEKDIYILGCHRLLCGDAASAADAGRLMDGAEGDMVFADPPGSPDFKAGIWQSRNDGGGKDAFRKFLIRAFLNLQKVSGPGAPIYVCHADREGLYFRTAMLEAGWEVRENIIWPRPSPEDSGEDYRCGHEAILYGWKPGHHEFYGSGRQTTVWKLPKGGKNGTGPLVKPVALCTRAITNSSREGDLVLDFFGGCGSTLLAAEETGRRCFMMEIDPRYCDVIVKRWENFTGRKAVRIRRDRDGD